ncbi:JmjC domain-containing protein [Archangium violaceum]|uniref:JmjC domain-containing protein n=1 Tax=Archangium violaceum TaxID=83451 RepID=UPI0036DE99AF
MKEGDSGQGLLAPEWRRWLVENLLRGTHEAELLAVLTGAGVDSERARAAVRAESEDPIFLGASKALAYQRKLEGLFDLYGDLYRQGEGHATVDRHEALPAEDFFARYYFLNKPVVVRGAVVDSAEAASWAPERLIARLVEDRLWLAEGAAQPRTACVPLLEHASLRTLADSLRPPATYVPADVHASTPRLWVEGVGALLPRRPARANVLLCQVRGRRRLQLIPAFELRRMVRDTEDADGVLRLEVEVGPGDMLLLPVGWWHGHSAVESGVAVSFESFAAPRPNTPWTPDGEELEPTPPPRTRAG